MIATLRALVGGALLTAILPLMGSRLPRSRRLWVWAAAIGFGNTTLTQVGISVGTARAGAAVAAVLLNSSPFFVALIARFGPERSGHMGSLQGMCLQAEEDNQPSHVHGEGHVLAPAGEGKAAQEPEGQCPLGRTRCRAPGFHPLSFRRNCHVGLQLRSRAMPGRQTDTPPEWPTYASIRVLVAHYHTETHMWGQHGENPSQIQDKISTTFEQIGDGLLTRACHDSLRRSIR